MKKFLIIFNILILCSCTGNKNNTLYQKLPATYSYVIGNVNDAEPKIAVADKIYVTPASCQKVITSILAYKILGEDFKYKTSLYHCSERNKSNDLIISFSGDPTLTTADLTKLLTPLKGKKYRKIILDATKFQTPSYSPNAMISDMASGYSSPVSSMIIDRNYLSMMIDSNAPNTPLESLSGSGYVVNSLVKTSDENTNLTAKMMGKTITLTGNIKRTDPPQQILISPLDLDYFILNKVKSINNELKIAGNIQIIHNKNELPSCKNLISEINSTRLIEFLPIGLKISDNIVFDSLYLTMVNRYMNLTDWSDGGDIIKGLVKEHLGVDMKNASIVDGSGLSRFNRIQTRTLYEILQKGFSNHAFVNSLARPGEDKSTLKTRKLLDTIRAKTGNVQGITCLCGYNNIDFNPQTFVMCASNFAPPVKPVFENIDQYLNSQLSR